MSEMTERMSAAMLAKGYGITESEAAEYARAAIDAMRDVPASMHKFHTKSGDLIDLSAPCSYCGGHEFAWQSIIDKALND